MEFEIAKKLEKLPAGAKGISLRSISFECGNAASMIIVSKVCGDIKNAVETFRMINNADINFRMRGKSIEISVNAPDALTVLMKFAADIKFNSEDAADVIEFYNKYMPLQCAETKTFSLDRDRLSIVIESDSLSPGDIMPQLDEYSMGIIKETDKK